MDSSSTDGGVQQRQCLIVDIACARVKARQMHVVGHAERAIQTAMLETSMTTSERSQTLDAHWIQFAQLQHGCVRGPWSRVGTAIPMRGSRVSYGYESEARPIPKHV